MNVEFVAEPGATEILAALVHEGRAFTGAGADLDKAASGALSRAMKASRFTGGGNSTLIVAAPAGLDVDSLVLSGLGETGKLERYFSEAPGEGG